MIKLYRNECIIPMNSIDEFMVEMLLVEVMIVVMVEVLCNIA